MFISITQKKKSLTAKVPTRLFPIMGAKGAPIYPDDHLSKHNDVNLDLFIVSCEIDSEVKVRFSNPRGRVESLISSLEGKATLIYNDLSFLLKVNLVFKKLDIVPVYTHTGRFIDVSFPKFKILKQESGNFTIM